MAKIAVGSKKRVAVVGLGAYGVAAVKNLLEAGFEVVGYERNSYIGGLWQWSADANLTTVLKTTRANIGKHRNCYQDFPFAEDTPNYPSADEIVKYLRSYAAHFGLYDHFKLEHHIKRLERSSDGERWALTVDSDQGTSTVETFDKVVVTTGSYQKAYMPHIDGCDEFKGQVLHAQAYKDANDFTGKRVVVVGLSNTGGDTAVDLTTAAAKVYLSHRSGARIMSRPADNETPTENRISRRMMDIGHAFNALLPHLSARLAARMVERKMISTNPFIDPSWNLLPAPPISNAVPVMNDHILEYLRDGKIASKSGIKCLKAPKSIEFTDGTVEENIDVIILATGYQADFSILSSEANPASFPTTDWDASPHSNGLVYPRLYYGLLSSVYPTSLAFIGPFRGHSFAIFNNADLSSTAVAQIFAGNYNLPPQAEIDKWCDENYAINLASIAKWRIVKPWTEPKALERWLNSAAGNAVNESLGWSPQAWSFWWNNRALYRLIMDGIDTPFIYRLFDGRGGENSRKVWPEAAAAIKKVNGIV